MTKRQFIRVAQPHNALKAVIEVFRKATELRQSERTRSGNRQSGDSIALIIETVAKLQSDALFRTGLLSRRKFKYVKQKWDSAGSQNPTPACSQVLKGYLSPGVATNPELIGAVPKKPTRTPLSLMPLTIVVPTPFGSSTVRKVPVFSLYTNPCVLPAVSV